LARLHRLHDPSRVLDDEFVVQVLDLVALARLALLEACRLRVSSRLARLGNQRLESRRVDDAVVRWVCRPIRCCQRDR
jgi:hypothetical protein